MATKRHAINKSSFEFFTFNPYTEWVAFHFNLEKMNRALLLS